MAIMGDDVRWVGNEKGLGRETEWNATVLTPGIYARSAENNKRLGVFSKAADLGSRKMLERPRNCSGIRRKWMCLSVRGGSIMRRKIAK